MSDEVNDADQQNFIGVVFACALGNPCRGPGSFRRVESLRSA